MKIVYVAKHDAGGACDEDAIAFALTKLGHEVVRVHERNGHDAWTNHRCGADLLLFHKWHDVEELKRWEGTCPRVFWWFDLVDFPSDPTLDARCRGRRDWMECIVPNVERGVMSDGDWVARDQTGKLSVLRQGCDERMLGIGRWPNPAHPPPAILMTGIRNGGGMGRAAFVDAMKEWAGASFSHVPSGIYREELANLIAGTRIVVAPDQPTTPRYWSNRVYNACGMGAFLLHPYCRDLASEYVHRKELVFYYDMESLKVEIAHYVEDAWARERIQYAAILRTQTEHTYRHRCVELIQRVFGGKASASA